MPADGKNWTGGRCSPAASRATWTGGRCSPAASRATWDLPAASPHHTPRSKFELINSTNYSSHKRRPLLLMTLDSIPVDYVSFSAAMFLFRFHLVLDLRCSIGFLPQPIIDDYCSLQTAINRPNRTFTSTPTFIVDQIEALPTIDDIGYNLRQFDSSFTMDFPFEFTFCNRFMQEIDLPQVST
ncbi:hypothetical protein LXL04_034070 [Taraxacum kok-saghyz]